ncbi:MAG TPA: ferric reductase-like transmembrane domain-containing protein [Patescibacteria group bacterium]
MKTSLWLSSILFSIVIFIVSLSYIFLVAGNLNLVVLSQTTALTGGILIGLSFVLSSLSYFFDFADSKLKYRKQLGLLGYYFAVAHSLSLIYRFPTTYVENFPHWLTQLPNILGLAAMFILTYMAIISTEAGMRLSGTYFRPLLRTGYLAYAFLIIRAYLIEGEMWHQWAWSLDTWPPPRLLLTVFALNVIFWRLAMEVSLQLKKKPVA